MIAPTLLMRTRKVPVAVDADTYADLQRIRDIDGIPISVQVRRALSEWIGRQWQAHADGEHRIHGLLRRQRLDRGRAIAAHTSAEWTALLREVGECVRCGATEFLQKDHIVPLCHGGSDGIENLQPLCMTCNCSKGPSEINWLARWRRRRANGDAPPAV